MAAAGLWVVCPALGQRLSEVFRLYTASLISTMPHNHPPYHHLSLVRYTEQQML